MASQLFKRADTMRISSDAGTKSKERQIHEYTFEYTVILFICTVNFIYLYMFCTSDIFAAQLPVVANRINLYISTCHIILRLHVYYLTFILEGGWGGGGSTVQTAKPAVGRNFPSLCCNICKFETTGCLSGSRCFKPRRDFFQTQAK